MILDIHYSQNYWQQFRRRDITVFNVTLTIKSIYDFVQSLYKSALQNIATVSI